MERGPDGVVARGWRLVLPIVPPPTMWPTLRLFQRLDASRPVPRRPQPQRENKPEQLKEFAHRLDSWSESRSNKSIFESWMGM